jgi:hypothetical protein
MLFFGDFQSFDLYFLLHLGLSELGAVFLFLVEVGEFTVSHLTDGF